MAGFDKVAVVTGGASGIGRATALRIARDGVAVAIWDLDQAAAAEAAAEIGARGGRAAAYTVDAASRTAIDDALTRTRAGLGPVTILINNAAITGIIPFLEISEEQWTG